MSRFEKITPRLPVSDVRVTIEFYEKVLGFAVDVLWPAAEPEFVILDRESISVGFYLVGSLGRPREAVGQGELYIQTNDANGLHRQLRERVAIEWGPEVYSYGRREFACRDPNGYLLIFTEETSDSPTTAEP